MNMKAAILSQVLRENGHILQKQKGRAIPDLDERCKAIAEDLHPSIGEEELRKALKYQRSISGHFPDAGEVGKAVRAIREHGEVKDAAKLNPNPVAKYVERADLIPITEVLAALTQGKKV